MAIHASPYPMLWHSRPRLCSPVGHASRAWPPVEQHGSASARRTYPLINGRSKQRPHKQLYPIPRVARFIGRIERNRCMPQASPLDTGRLRRPYSRLRGDLPPADQSPATESIRWLTFSSELKPRSIPPATRCCRASAGFALRHLLQEVAPLGTHSTRFLE